MYTGNYKLFRTPLIKQLNQELQKVRHTKFMFQKMKIQN